MLCRWLAPGRCGWDRLRVRMSQNTLEQGHERLGLRVLGLQTQRVFCGNTDAVAETCAVSFAGLV